MAKMLIADDNKQITSILSNYARKEGFEPVVALDGEEALRLFDEHEPDIAMVLLDVMMPKVDGFEVCRRLRGKSLVPVIMVTAEKILKKSWGLISAPTIILLSLSARAKLWRACVQFCAACSRVRKKLRIIFTGTAI